MLDGQVSVVKNYLEVKPENLERIKKLVGAGKLLIGPFYILPDEFLVSPEAIIRNLLWGINESKKLGRYMPIAYLCDMAGHPTQMPQILQGFGLDTMVAWRGVLGYHEIKKSEFFWTAPDKSRVLFIVMPFGYVNFGRLPSDKTKILKIVKDNIKKLSPLSSSGHILFMEGFDHQEPREDIPEIIAYLAKQLPEYEFVHSSLPEYVRCLTEKLPSNITDFEGELRRSLTSYILPGIYSCRLPLKKETAQAELLLERLSEPISSLAHLTGQFRYPKEFLDLAWKIEFNNQFHDVIYGAHIDEVTDNALDRVKQVRVIANRIKSEAFHALASGVRTKNKTNLVFFNPTPCRLSGVFEFPVYIDPQEEIYQYVLKNEEGDLIPFSVETVREYRRYLSERNLIDYYSKGKTVKEYKLLAYFEDIPAFGFRVLALDPFKDSILGERLKKQEETFKNEGWLSIWPAPLKLEKGVFSGSDHMENEYLKVSFNQDGTFNLKEKPNGKIYRHLGFLEDSGDRGDHYIFSPPEENKIVYSSETHIEKLFDSPLKTAFLIKLSLFIPQGLNRDRRKRSLNKIQQEVEILYILRAKAKNLEVRIKFQNKAMNHRLRIGFPVGKGLDNTELESFFDVVKRDTHLPNGTLWSEKPQPTAPQRRFLYAGDKGGGLLLVNPGGLQEYEVTPSGIVYITLLRSLDLLSVGTLPERSFSHTGPELPTPGAQYLNEFVEAELSIFPLKSHWSTLGSFSFADYFIKPLSIQLDKNEEGFIHPGEALIQLTPEKVFMSAFKRKEKEDSFILRLWNPLREEMDVYIRLSPVLGIKEVYRTDLLEEKREQLNYKDGTVSLRIGVKKIITLSLVKGK
jgi:mannosylglycerate hydrolase